MTDTTVAVSVGIGLVVGLLGSEFFGLAATGLVVPGYLALHLHRPVALVATLAIAFAALGAVRGIATFTILHGRRRAAALLLVSYLLGLLATSWSGLLGTPADDATIGLVISGLIALGMDKHGVLGTLSALTIASVLVRLVLIASGMELPA